MTLWYVDRFHEVLAEAGLLATPPVLTHSVAAHCDARHALRIARMRRINS